MNALDHLIGKKVVNATVDTLTLSDGTRLQFDREEFDCCTWMGLLSLSTVDSIITAAEFRDNEDETGGEGAYKAWLHVVTEAGELNIAEAEGDAGNGYYLHGFALGVAVLPAELEAVDPETAAEIRVADAIARYKAGRYCPDCGNPKTSLAHGTRCLSTTKENER